MKKSEVKDMIKKIMYKNINLNPDDIATLILNSVLKAGMLPPSTEFKMGDKMIRDNIWDKENNGK